MLCTCLAAPQRPADVGCFKSVGPVYPDPPRKPGWLLPLLLGWAVLLCLAVVAARLAFDAVDVIVQEQAPGAPTARRLNDVEPQRNELGAGTMG